MGVFTSHLALWHLSKVTASLLIASQLHCETLIRLQSLLGGPLSLDRSATPLEWMHVVVLWLFAAYGKLP